MPARPDGRTGGGGDEPPRDLGSPVVTTEAEPETRYGSRSRCMTPRWRPYAWCSAKCQGRARLGPRSDRVRKVIDQRVSRQRGDAMLPIVADFACQHDRPRGVPAGRSAGRTRRAAGAAAAGRRARRAKVRPPVRTPAGRGASRSSRPDRSGSAAPARTPPAASPAKAATRARRGSRKAGIAVDAANPPVSKSYDQPKLAVSRLPVQP